MTRQKSRRRSRKNRTRKISNHKKNSRYRLSRRTAIFRKIRVSVRRHLYDKVSVTCSLLRHLELALGVNCITTQSNNDIKSSDGEHLASSLRQA